MNFINYFFQANIYLVIFYLFYQLLLSKETHFKLNRIYLITAVFCTFAIPFLRFEWFNLNSAAYLININVSGVLSGTANVQAAKFDWQDVILPIYFTGALFSVIVLGYKLLRIKSLMAHPAKGLAFSFFNRKVVDASLPGYETINKHEEAHIRQMHSFDILLFEIAAIFAWFNPIIYFYKNSIKQVHEYLADEEAVKYEGDKRRYALLLLNAAMGITPAISNPFMMGSLTKQRIVMLHKARSARKTLLKYVLFIPLFAGMIVFSSAIAPQSGHNKDLSSLDIRPEFPGGFIKFSEYLVASTKYPLQAKIDHVAGKVLVGFSVDETGAVIDVNVIKGINADLDKEALRVVSSSVKWKPGIVDGAAVNVKLAININFSKDKKG